MPMVNPSLRYGPVEHARFLRDGYCLLPGLLTEAGLERGRAMIDDMLNRLQPGRQPDEIFSAHQQEPWIFEFATQQPLLDIVEQQIGPDIVLWSTHLICKRPRTGREIPWHQDAPYWNVSGRLSGAIWIAFDDIDTDNGGMAVLPGWHGRGTLPVRPRGQSFFDDEIDPSALPSDPDAVKVQYRFPAGDGATHDVMIPHNSIPNRSDRWRRVLVLRYMAADGQMGTKRYEDYRTGQPFARQFYLVRGRDVAGRGLPRSPF